MILLAGGSSSDDDNLFDFEPGAWAEMAALADINVARAASLVPHGMVAESVGTWNTNATNDNTFALGAGLGLNWRVAPRVAIHPDISVLRVPSSDAPGQDGLPRTYVFFATAVTMGPQPVF